MKHSNKNPLPSQAEMRRRIAADLDASIARGTVSNSDRTCVQQPTDLDKSIAAEEVRYAEERRQYRRNATCPRSKS